MEYTITVKLSSDNYMTVADLSRLIGEIAPYMVDNVSIHTKGEK